MLPGYSARGQRTGRVLLRERSEVLLRFGVTTYNATPDDRDDDNECLEIFDHPDISFDGGRADCHVPAVRR
jgi:hypothetical protein